MEEVLCRWFFVCVWAKCFSSLGNIVFDITKNSPLGISLESLCHTINPSKLSKLNEIFLLDKLTETPSIDFEAVLRLDIDSNVRGRGCNFGVALPWLCSSAVGQQSSRAVDGNKSGVPFPFVWVQALRADTD
ncbi:hypothetical protein TorRG33x02_018630 [Trema orientale]|uniref:LRR domain containing protein n=1 Tax=Trema orientale TaxID=63057 RepID=A0A2P5FWC1_TREOI|nr:hypothetical protein TorRG33x02_018630 [Trema orientale]